MSSLHKDIKELVLDRLTPKQLIRFDRARGTRWERIRRVCKAGWIDDAIAEVRRRDEERREKKYQQYVAFVRQVKDRTFFAKVLWFNRSTGEGMVGIPDLGNQHFDLYACNIKGRKTWYPKTACVYYEKDQVIEVSLSLHGMGQPIFTIGETPGCLDTEKWNSLDQNKLAFKCNEHGEAVTGLLQY